MNEQKKIDVIGVGGRGTLADLFNNADRHSRVVAGADLNEKRLAEFRERNRDVTFVTTNYREML